MYLKVTRLMELSSTFLAMMFWRRLDFFSDLMLSLEMRSKRVSSGEYLPTPIMLTLVRVSFDHYIVRLAK